MSQVETVRGPVESSALGRTLMHEHIFVLTPEIQANFPAEWGSEDVRVAEAVARLRELAEVGVATIVDPTVLGLGRYIPRIATIAEQVPDLNIVVATGAYTYTDAPNYFRFRLDTGAGDPMVAMFTADITEGIAGTGIKAGVLKCAIDEPGLTPGVERILRAVGRTHLDTGTPITVHTHPGTHTGLHVRRILVDELGVDPGRVVLGHSGDSLDADHLSELADAGFILGMDRFGINRAVTFEQRCDIVLELCRRGYAKQMVLSHDAACYLDWIDPALLPMLPQWNYLHIEQDVLPYLRDHGIAEEHISAMLVDNPRRYFEG